MTPSMFTHSECTGARSCAPEGSATGPGRCSASKFRGRHQWYPRTQLNSAVAVEAVSCTDRQQYDRKSSIGGQELDGPL